METNLEFTVRFYRDIQNILDETVTKNVLEFIKTTLSEISVTDFFSKKNHSLPDTCKLWEIKSQQISPPYKFVIELIENSDHLKLRLITFTLDISDHSSGKQEQVEPNNSVKSSFLINPVTKETFIKIYTTKELILLYSQNEGFSVEDCTVLNNCVTITDAIQYIRSIEEGYNSFAHFISNQTKIPNDLERIYSIKLNNISQIAEHDIFSFKLKIDKEQREAINRPSDDNLPFIVQGAAGTGKSIVCLYRMRKMLADRTHETLFDEGQSKYLFVTFTNTLTNSSKFLFEELVGNMNITNTDIQFSTFDSILVNLAKKLRESGAAIPNLPHDTKNDPIHTAYHNTLASDCRDEDKKLLRKMGAQFFIREVEEVLIDKGIENLDEYLETGQANKILRKGLIIRLVESHRKAIWVGFQTLLGTIQKEGIAPWVFFRKKILDAYDDHSRHFHQYTAIFADEVQDFGNIQMRLLVKLCKHPGGLILAKDIGQTIYRRQGNLSSIDQAFEYKGSNNVILKNSYRMTKEVHDALSPRAQ